jgi:protein CpxP
MNAKRIIVLLALASVLSLGVFAQDQQQGTSAQPAPAPAPQNRPRRDPVAVRMRQLTRRLNLTQNQQDQIKPLLQDEMKQTRAIRQDASLTPDQKREKLQQLRQSSRSHLEDLLTPEQVAKLPKPGQAQRNAFVHMARRLNLTQDQQDKIRPLMADQRKQVQTVRLDSSLTPQQKQVRIRDIRRSTQKQVAALLTPAQRQQLRQMRRNMRRRRMMGRQPNQAPAAPAQQTPAAPSQSEPQQSPGV